MSNNIWCSLGFEAGNERDSTWINYKEFNKSPTKLADEIQVDLDSGTSMEKVFSNAYNSTNLARNINGHIPISDPQIATLNTNFSQLKSINWEIEGDGENFLKKTLTFMVQVLNQTDLFSNAKDSQSVPFIELTKITYPILNHSGLPPMFAARGNQKGYCSWNSPMDSGMDENGHFEQYLKYNEAGIYLQFNHRQIAFILANTFFGNSLNVNVGMYNSDLSSLLYQFSKCGDPAQMINMLTFFHRMKDELYTSNKELADGYNVVMSIPKEFDGGVKNNQNLPSLKLKKGDYDSEMSLSQIGTCNMNDNSLYPKETSVLKASQCGAILDEYKSFNDTKLFSNYNTTNPSAKNENPFGADQFNQKLSPKTIIVDISGTNVGGYGGLCEGQYQDEGSISKFIEVVFFHFFSYTPVADGGPGRTGTNGLGAPALFLGVRNYTNAMSGQAILADLKYTALNEPQYGYKYISPINQNIPKDVGSTASFNGDNKMYQTGFLNLVTTDARDYKEFLDTKHEGSLNLYEMQQKIYSPFNTSALAQSACVDKDTTAFDINLNTTYRSINPSFYPAVVGDFISKNIDNIAMGNLGYGDFMNDAQASFWFSWLAFSCATHDQKSLKTPNLAYYVSSRNIECSQLAGTLFDKDNCQNCIDYNSVKNTCKPSPCGWGKCTVRDAATASWNWAWNWQWDEITKKDSSTGKNQLDELCAHSYNYTKFIDSMQGSSKKWSTIYNNTLKAHDKSLFEDIA